MCGRFTLTVSLDTLQQAFQLKNGLCMVPRYNIAPSNFIPVIKAPQLIDFLQWGLKPKWLEDKNKNGFINARVETLSEKPAFRESFRKRRCLILADGYFEWKLLGRTKQPFYIRRKDRSVFAFAGIWEGDSCAIITTAAFSHLSELHARMPLILPAKAYDTWLNVASKVGSLTLSLLNPLQSEELEIYPVSTRMNDPSVEGPECIQSLQ